jgi:hypothetical protein
MLLTSGRYLKSECSNADHPTSLEHEVRLNRPNDENGRHRCMSADYPTISMAADLKLQLKHRCLQYPARLRGVVRDMACNAVIQMPHMTRVALYTGSRGAAREERHGTVGVRNSRASQDGE